MARPVEYDLEDVLDKAMGLFCEKGFESVSMADLVAHTGLNRRTMYSLFKDKDGLYKDALENFYSKMACKQITALRNNRGKKGIEIFFEPFSFGCESKGCLYTNTIIEKNFVNCDAFNTVKDFYNNVRTELEKNLTEAAEDGDFNGDKKATALTLITIVQGLGLYGRFNESQEDSKTIIKNVLSSIR